jgi:type IV pilus assembly protein PilA
MFSSSYNAHIHQLPQIGGYNKNNNHYNIMKIQSIKSSKKGFSLIELLVVIAVIGIIAAIALPAMSGIFDRSRETKNRRNAQSISATFNAAQQAGAFKETTAGVPTFAAATPAASEMATLATYFGTPKKGQGVEANSFFSINIDAAEAQACASFLTYDANSKILSYKAGGDGVATP